MFKCQKCKKSSKIPNRVVVERKMIDHVGQGERPGGRGSQIVREEVVCDECKPLTPEAPLVKFEKNESEPIATIGDAA